MGIYLLDTCIWEYWFNPNREQHSQVVRHVDQLSDDDKIGISIITWGEIIYGYKANADDPRLMQSEYFQFITSKSPKIYYIDMHVAQRYGEVRALLFEKFASKEKRKKGLRPEQLIDPITAKELGIQENDLWITAQALERNITLVTHDKLYRISEVVGDDLQIENWAIEWMSG